MEFRSGCRVCLSLDGLAGCLYKRVLDMANIGVAVTDRAGYFKYLNPIYAEMFEMDIEAALTRNINDYFPNSKLMVVMETGLPDKAIKFSFKGQDALVNRYPIWEDGEVVGGLLEVYFRDIQVLKDLMTKMDVLEKKIQYYKRRTQGLPGARYTFDDLIGESECIRNFKALGHRFARTSRPVLLQGESGTGKELAAHAVHSASPRQKEVFISVNCAAIPKDLLEAELFGFEEGTFTGAKTGGKVGKFELADRGTIFLDEIGELPLEMQAKLLRVIENGEIQKIGASSYTSSDFRLVAATNKDLHVAVKAGIFREDLYHRLNILSITVPPLRERTEDIFPIAHHILAEQAETPQSIAFAPEVKHLFLSYSWPGNIRELRNVLSYAATSMDQGQNEIKLRNLPPYLIEKGLIRTLPTSPTGSVGSHRAGASLIDARDKTEREILVNALEITGGNKSKAAKVLGISRNEVYKKIKKHGLGEESQPGGHGTQ